MKVLIATEGSEFSNEAVNKCCRMFDESENTEIRIISAVKPVVMTAVPFAVSADGIREIEGAAVKTAQRVVNQTGAAIRKRFPDLAVGLTTKVLTGLPKQVIVEEAKNWGADLIIMGSHGYGSRRRSVLGSVSNSVLRHAPCSVLVVRPPQNIKNQSKPSPA